MTSLHIVLIATFLIGRTSSFLTFSSWSSSPISTVVASSRSNQEEVAPAEEEVAGEDNFSLLVLGKGFLGTEILRQCKLRNITARSTSTSGEDSTIALDLTSDDADKQMSQIAKGCKGVISTVGSIGTKSDLEVNAASSKAAIGAKDAGVERFVFIGNDPRIRDLSKSVPFLQNYAKGKEKSEQTIQELFGINGCIIKPTFIYGGDEFGISPPRVASSVGQIAEEVLGLYPIVALSKSLPDALGAPLEVPVSVESVAGAAINVALGLCEGYTALDTKDLIVMASTSHRPRGCIDDDECSIEEAEEIQDRRDEIKRLLTTTTSESHQHDDIALMEELESLRPLSTRPAYDESLNSRWDFVLSKSDLGTEFIKELTSSDGNSNNPLLSPLKFIYDLRDVYMEINEQSIVNIALKSKVLGQSVDIVLTTSLLPMAYDEATDGTLFVEQFEGIKVAGINLPIPKSWQRSRYLEISYLDDDLMIARGNAGEPHILLRGKNR